MNAQFGPDIRYGPIELWRVAQRFLNVIYNLFGEPEAIAAKHTLTRKDHELVSSWLRAAEAMMRRLLMIEAAHVAPETERKQRRRSVRKTRTIIEASPQYAGDTSTWRVTFRCIPERRRPRRRTRGRGKELRFLSSWPLAKRYEAMIRVFNNPHAYAKQLARRLRADPKLAAIVLRAPPEYGHRVERPEQLTEAAEAAWPLPDSS